MTSVGKCTLKYWIGAVLVTLLCACATQESEKLVITGTRIPASEVPKGPKISFKPEKGQKGREILAKITGMKELIQPSAFESCKELLMLLAGTDIEVLYTTRKTVVVRSVHGVYTYEFEQAGCPVKEA